MELEKEFYNWRAFGSQLYENNNYEYVHSHAFLFNNIVEEQSKMIEVATNLKSIVIQMIKDERAFFAYLENKMIDNINKRMGTNYTDKASIKDLVQEEFKTFKNTANTPFKMISDLKSNILIITESLGDKSSKTKNATQNKLNFIRQISDPKNYSLLVDQIKSPTFDKDVSEFMKANEQTFKNLVDTYKSTIWYLANNANIFGVISSDFERQNKKSKEVSGAMYNANKYMHIAVHNIFNKEITKDTMLNIKPEETVALLDRLLDSATDKERFDFLVAVASTNSYFDITKGVDASRALAQVNVQAGQIFEPAFINTLLQKGINEQLALGFARLLAPDLASLEKKGQSTDFQKISVIDTSTMTYKDTTLNKDVIIGFSQKLKGEAKLGSPKRGYIYFDNDFIKKTTSYINAKGESKVLSINTFEDDKKYWLYLRRNIWALSLFSLDENNDRDEGMQKYLDIKDMVWNTEAEIAKWVLSTRVMNGVFEAVKGQDGSFQFQNAATPEGEETSKLYTTVFLLTQDELFWITDLLDGLLNILSNESGSKKIIAMPENKEWKNMYGLTLSDLQNVWDQKSKIWSSTNMDYPTALDGLSSTLDSLRKALEQSPITHVFYELNANTLYNKR